jgi:aconitate hydratase 2/2-methylisocitrate dehydratase
LLIISFPAVSGLVAFGAALGVILLDTPESALVKFTGEMQPGIRSVCYCF